MEGQLEPRVLILLPTTGNRIPQLRMSIESVRRQHHRNWSLVVLCDGTTPEVERFVAEQGRVDERISYVAFQKSIRRGETERHKIINAPSSQSAAFIAYLCDRDLWFPEHLSMGLLALRNKPFGLHAAQGWAAAPDGSCWPAQNPVQNWNPASGPLKSNPESSFQLSSVIHSRALYESTPGWTTTPRNINETDVYMWTKLCRVPEMELVSHPIVTYMYFAKAFFKGFEHHEETARSIFNRICADPDALRLELFIKHVPRLREQFIRWNQKWLWFYRGPSVRLRKIFLRWPGAGRPLRYPE